jgi:surfactin synthase thioesterase subunit
MALQANDYLVVPKSCANVRARIVCFPHSGGGPSAYAAWPDLLEPRQVEVAVVSLPGRERRLDTPPLTEWSELVSKV